MEGDKAEFVKVSRSIVKKHKILYKMKGFSGCFNEIALVTLQSREVHMQIIKSSFKYVPIIVGFIKLYFL